MDNVNEIKTDDIQNKDLINESPSTQDELRPKDSGVVDFHRGSEYTKTKIKNSIQDFLELETRDLPLQASGTRYDLEEEYGETRRNAWKNAAPVLMWMLAAILFVGLMAGTIVSIVNKQNSKLAVEVESFDNLNLSNLLNLVSSTQTQVNEESANKNALESRRKTIADQAEAERASALATLNSINIQNSAERRAREKEIQDAYDESMKSVAELDAKIEESKQKISLYQQQLAQYDTATVQQAQMHRLETQQLTDDYEKRIIGLRDDIRNIQQEALEKQEEMVNYVIGQYDPTFDEDKTVLALVAKSSAYDNRYTGSSVGVNEKASQEFREALEKQKAYYSELSTVGSKFLRIPQKNGIPKFAASIQKIANRAGNDLALASVNEINNLIGKNDELSSRNQSLESENENLSTQVQGLETEKQELTEKNGTLIEEKTALENSNATLANEKNELSAANTELSNTNSELASVNESLSSAKESLTKELENLSKEKDNWNAELKSKEDAWASEKTSLEAAAKDAMEKAESTRGTIDSLNAEKESWASEKAELSARAEKLMADYKTLETEREILDDQTKSLAKENSSLAKERDNLSQSNKSLQNQNDQYAQLLQAFCVKDGRKTHGFVSNVNSGRRVQLYVEKSAYSKYAELAVPGVIVPVAIVRNGKIVAAGKLSIENGVSYMIKGTEEDQVMVESVMNLESANDYSIINVGDEIQISDPL